LHLSYSLAQADLLLIRLFPPMELILLRLLILVLLGAIMNGLVPGCYFSLVGLLGTDLYWVFLLPASHGDVHLEKYLFLSPSPLRLCPIFVFLPSAGCA